LRLWTLHPRYLDPQGLVALWREGLLARAVLRGETRGYRHHPQLQRFQQHAAPLAAIDTYLLAVHDESLVRGYSFDRGKLGRPRRPALIPGTRGQLDYEWQHLLHKLRQRSPALAEKWGGLAAPEPHPLFSIRAGPVAPWERVDG
jgi:hypothetical protein